MATVTLKGNAINTSGNLPEVGTKSPEFSLTTGDLAMHSLTHYAGSKLVLNVFPSIDTGTCAQSVRTFNKEAAELENTKVLCISNGSWILFSYFNNRVDCSTFSHWFSNEFRRCEYSY